MVRFVVSQHHKHVFFWKMNKETPSPWILPKQMTDFCGHNWLVLTSLTFSFGKTSPQTTQRSKQFSYCVISRFDYVNWPPSSTDLMPLDEFLWGHLKDQTTDALKDNIRRYIDEVSEAFLQNVLQKFVKRPPYLWKIIRYNLTFSGGYV